MTDSHILHRSAFKERSSFSPKMTAVQFTHSVKMVAVQRVGHHCIWRCSSYLSEFGRAACSMRQTVHFIFGWMAGLSHSCCRIALCVAKLTFHLGAMGSRAGFLFLATRTLYIDAVR